MKTEVETFDDAAAFRDALRGKPRQRRGRNTRPDVPSALAGEGDRIAQLGRIAAFGFAPRWDLGVGFSFWNVTTGARTAAHAAYADACIAAEKELSI